MTSPEAGPRSTWRWSGWLRETRRTTAATVVALLAQLPLILTEQSPASLGAEVMDTLVAFTAVYLPVYLVLTCVVFIRAPDDAIARWARRDGRGSWLQRYVYGTAPGPGLSITMGTIALLVSVLWLPNTDLSDSGLPAGIRLTLGLLVLVSSWSAVAVSFAVAYHADDLLEDRTALDFPGTERAGWSDYLYFAIAVSTTFGTTDVTVRSPTLRRTVTVHGLLAFVFNTVILGAVVGFLVSR